ncbi:hypothetical protein [Arabidopsis thaliana]|jgi:hypothetical protein|uniref:At4g13320 n=2 Tax=Arabidopsis thaliana TaxID=3702 RepID=Q9T0K3_ARATH|nr:uncharacterized protein AT4G13320 [Arabidopsis thaliana]AAR25634.1 At4g13320 [Arabidopsis thaliana]AEE83263.1 hypothetical protein AT4G13320 [Arabidopsis thaliana]CAA0395077.1 unnamed protein product [Arabidopsis thaliana]CAB40767.1 hypothetical protein [Arabidopsis thaliana]CAB78374.1 hypothetical protein [Arabidopsis thaliana]|eukprot:NP_193068.1 hypothetical protein AT4G13320 [Arabidopsis thaliana]
MAEDRSSKIQALDIESNIERRFEEMEQTLIRIQQEDTATNESSQWRPQPTDWNARNMTPIEVSAILLHQEDNHHHDQQTQQGSSNTITNFFDWKPDFVFRTQCVINDEACRLVLYGGNNIISKGLVKQLKLKTLKKYPSVRVMATRREDKVAEETCRVPVSIGDFYKDKVTCYVVNMEEEEDQLLFGGPWLYRVQATHNGRDDSCMIIWNHNMILL